MARYVQPSLVWAVLGSFVFLGALPASVAGEETCLEALASEVKSRETIEVVAHDGRSTKGKFLRADPQAGQLWLSVYDSQKSRFLDRAFDRPAIHAIRLHRVRVNLTVPLLFGIGFGGAALALGAHFEEDSGEGAAGSRAKAVAIMTGIGFLTGFVTGYGVAWAGRQVEDHAFSCGP